eukprot:Skav218286  [mRNA]  locus=scaffold2035:643685:653450:- [translate_table: standard]
MPAISPVPMVSLAQGQFRCGEPAAGAPDLRGGNQRGTSSQPAALLCTERSRTREAEDQGARTSPEGSPCGLPLSSASQAVARIKDFLLQKVNSLKKPKPATQLHRTGEDLLIFEALRTNLQILQRNVLVRFKSMTQWEPELPVVGGTPHCTSALAGSWQSTMLVWRRRFRTYVTSLQKLELEYAATKSDLLVSEGQSAGRLWDNLGLGRSVQLKDKGNVFSLSGRDAILEQLDKDPIIAHTNKDKVKYYHEQLFRSHQMLLMDGSWHLGRYFLDSLEAFLANCWDSVGLLLMVRIVDFYRKRMQQRKVSCLDSYLDALQLLLWPRLRVVLEANIVSLRKVTPSNCGKWEE